MLEVRSVQSGEYRRRFATVRFRTLEGEEAVTRVDWRRAVPEEGIRVRYDPAAPQRARADDPGDFPYRGVASLLVVLGAGLAFLVTGAVKVL